MPKIVSNFVEIYVYSPRLKKFLLLKRAKDRHLHPGIWQTVTATCDEGETTKATILRELNEETGLKSKRVFVVPRVNSYYMVPLDVISMSPVFFAETENSDVRLSEEHEEFRWVTFKEALKLIHWEDQAESLRIIHKYLKDKKLFEKLVEMNIGTH